jgi:hypothetical protein
MSDSTWEVARGGEVGSFRSRRWNACGGRFGEMELGGVGNKAGWAREASRPEEAKAERGFGISTEAVLPARAIAMLEGVFNAAMMEAEMCDGGRTKGVRIAGG